MITIDFETYWDKEFSLSKMTTESYIRDPRFEIIGFCIKKDDGPIQWVPGNSKAQMKRILHQYNVPDEVVVAHNAVFDMAIMNWVLGIRPRVIVDTLSMSRPITGLTVGGTLRALAEYFGLGHKGTEVYNTLGKHRKDFTDEELERFGDYCKQDVNLTYQLFQKLQPFTTAQELYLIDLTIRMFTEPVLELNAELLETHLEKVKADKQNLLDSVAHGDRSAFMSNDKFAELLRAEGVEPPTKVSPTTGKEAYAFAKTDAGFQALLDHPNERVQALASARLGLKSTLEETRTQSFLDIARRGRLPILLNYYGAANTGRMSGGDRVNPQNLPRGGVLREAIRAPEGYTIVACDSSQIEARTLAWFAGQTDLVEAFANNEDIYSKFASSVYDKPINKYDNPEERHVGKTCILGLGYNTGALTLQRSLANGFIKVKLPAEECKRIVDLYRTQYASIPRLWKSCQRAIENMYMGYDAVVGTVCPLQVSGQDRTIRMPNGLFLRYPDLQAEQNERGFNEYTYQKKRFRARLYGGALCIAKGTPVVTQRGLVPIEAVSSQDIVWDGEAWVHTCGAIYKGTAECIEAYGVLMTEDHKVLTTEGWKSASQSKRFNRAPCRLPEGYQVRWVEREEVAMANTMRLREGANDACLGVHEEAQGREVPQLWTRLKGTPECHEEKTWDDQSTDLQCVALDEREMRNAHSASMEELWGSRDNCMLRVEPVVREVLRGHGSDIQEGTAIRQDQQRERLFEGKLPLGNAQRELQQSPTQCSDRREATISMGRRDRDRLDDSSLPPQTQLSKGAPIRQTRFVTEVFDLVNCGQRNRFVVIGAEGPIIVHNCENIIQGLARTIVSYQMCKIKQALDKRCKELNDSKTRRVVHMVHDEVIVVVPEDEAEWTKSLMEKIMSTPPSWAKSLPVSCEAGLGKTYADAK